jgi:hypothetical protein
MLLVEQAFANPNDDAVKRISLRSIDARFHGWYGNRA